MIASSPTHLSKSQCMSFMRAFCVKSVLFSQNLEMSERMHLADYQTFIAHEHTAKNLMGNLTKERFSAIVDVQELVQRYTTQRDDLEVRSG